MMATHSPPSAMAWIVYTMNAVYWLVTLTSPALVGMRIGLILVWGIENDTVEHRVEQGFEHRCVDDLGVMAHLRQGAFRIGGKIRILFDGDHAAAVCRPLRDCCGQNARTGAQIKDADGLMCWSEQAGGLIGDRSGRQKLLEALLRLG
jgi:hypothetical protein